MNTHLLPLLRGVLASLAVTVFLAGASVARAQVNIYAKFQSGTGVWAGESTASNRTGWVELRAVSTGADVNLDLGGGISTGRLLFRPINLEKAVDRITPQLLATMGSGAPINAGAGNSDVTIEFVRTTQAGPVVFFRIELKYVFVASISTAGAAGDDTINENVTLQYGAARYTTTPILPNGTLGTPAIQTWNQVNNNSSFTVNP